MADLARARRLAVRIREIVASTLEMQVKDPRLGMVTITDARVTPDLREVTLFYTVLGDETDRADSATALESARGVLRSQVGRQTGLKFTPTLEFVLDAVPETAESIEALLAQARDADAELRRARAGASYAGDPEPYRVIEEEAGAPAGDVSGNGAGDPAGAGNGVAHPGAAE
jgi:ribosome-binding factor A